MSHRMRDLLDNTEQRVAERTHALGSVVRSLKMTTEISHQIATILDLDKLLQYVVDRIQHDFGYYHVHIYLVDE
jgi:nitrate/nitrite-specific signal transduction histidine kinase